MLIKHFSRKAATHLSFSLISAAIVLPMQPTASNAQSAEQLVRPTAVKQVRSQRSTQRPNTQIEPALTTPGPNLPIGSNGPVYGGNGCPEGTILVMFDMPIYDDDGLFVIGFEPIPFCIDEDTEPAG
ncbi:MAG: hypothetical protein AAFQ61_04090 [Cyanobacteria bacterium J06626_23]